jgi:hypothetical protein
MTYEGGEMDPVSVARAQRAYWEVDRYRIALMAERSPYAPDERFISTDEYDDRLDLLEDLKTNFEKLGEHYAFHIGQQVSKGMTATKAIIDEYAKHMNVVVPVVKDFMHQYHIYITLPAERANGNFRSPPSKKPAVKLPERKFNAGPQKNPFEKRGKKK